MNSILVTGGAGFIGSHFIELLLTQTDAHIVCVDNLAPNYDPAQKRANLAAFAYQDRVSICEQDFCNGRQMADIFDEYEVEYVVHLGALPGVRQSVLHPLIYERTNVQGTLTLLEAARRRPVRKFLLTSSSTVYGKGAPTPFREDASPGVPASPYGVTKRSAELFGFTYHELHGVPVTCLRPFSVYGSRLRPDLALSIFTHAIAEGETITLFGDGSTLRDFTHVSDICDGIYAALTAPGIEGEAINLGCGHPIRMSRVIAAIEEAVGRQAIIRPRPSREEDLAATHADITKARRLLGYEPKIQFEEGMRDYVTWALSEKVTV